MPWKRDRVSELDATIHLIALGADHVGPHKARRAARTQRPECPMFMLFCLTTTREQTLHSKVVVDAFKQMSNNVLMRIIREVLMSEV